MKRLGWMSTLIDVFLVIILLLYLIDVLLFLLPGFDFMDIMKRVLWSRLVRDRNPVDDLRVGEVPA